MRKLFQIPIFYLLLIPLGLPALPPSVFPARRPRVPLGPRTANLPLPDGYSRYKFGMKRSQVLTMLKKDRVLRSYDADFIEGFEQENWTVLSTVGLPYFKNIYFLFYKKKLYGIMIVFNRIRFSYQEVINSLIKKYGRPNLLGQDMTVWQDKKYRLQLENSVHLKYLDLVRFKKVKKNFNPALLQKKLNKKRALEKL